MSCDIIFCDKTYATCKVIMFKSDLVCRPAEYKSLGNFLKVKHWLHKAICKYVVFL